MGSVLSLLSRQRRGESMSLWELTCWGRAGAMRNGVSLQVKCREQVLTEEDGELKEVGCTWTEPEQLGPRAPQAPEDECPQFGELGSRQR